MTFIIIFVMFSFTVTASSSVSSEIYNTAMELKRDDIIQTVWTIDTFVDNKIQYSYMYSPIGIYDAWRKGKGDCTERAELKVYMLNLVGIKAKTMHGYYYGDKHDTYKFYYNGSYRYPESETVIVGEGIW